MPIYEFLCKDCGKVYEEICAPDAAPACPHCGGEGIRQLSMPGPLKKGAFPFKPGPVHPLARRMAQGGGCGGACPGA